MARWCGMALAMALLAGRAVNAQPRGAGELAQLVRGLTVTPRVLLIGAHPDDDDPQLIAWLARGRHVETAYLSLTRGESGENFIGTASGVALGAIRTGELLAARRIDGGRSFFTRAIDFGVSRTADEAFKRWDRTTLLADVVTVARAFRPHVVVSVFADSAADGDGQHQAAAQLARDAYQLAADTTRCPVAVCGAPWTPLKLYMRADGVPRDGDAYDPVLGRTYAEIARESQAQHRSGGLAKLAASWRRSAPAEWRRPVAARSGAVAGVAEQSIFDGVDTSFARLGKGMPEELAGALARFAALADSVRAALDLQRPHASVPQLARAVRIIDGVRATAPWCRHPSADAAPPAAAGAGPCDDRALDLDAAIDLAQRRAREALLAAAGVAVEAVADRELVGHKGRMFVTVSVANRGAAPLVVNDVTVSGGDARDPTSLTVAPGGTGRLSLAASAPGSARPWWIGTRKNEAFEAKVSAIDGLERPADVPAPATVPGVAIPEEIRRLSDVRITVTIAGVTTSASVGPVTYRAISPTLGVQQRQVGGVPDVTVSLQRGLEWLRAGRPVDRLLRVTLRSFATNRQTISLTAPLVPTGIRLESLPPRITLEPREQRDIFIRLRGALAAGRHEFGIVARSATNEPYFEGFRAYEHPHVQPVRTFRNSGAYLQAVPLDSPTGLVVAYVGGPGDEGEGVLRQIGIESRLLTPEQLAGIDLSPFTTIVIGPRAYESLPELVGLNPRIHEFARKGGTVVVLNAQYGTTRSSALAYPVALTEPVPEHVTDPEAPVTAIEPRSRLLTWPNRLTAEDWGWWVRERALYVPTAVDSAYTPVVEMHDPGQRPNRNAILVAALGRGTYVYTTLTLMQQIGGGVPGALRLFVNLLSAGCRPGGAGPAGC